MKRPGLTPAVASATLFLTLSLPPAVSAQEMMAGSQAERAGKRAEELLKRFDKNGDGRLDDDERADAKEFTLKEQVDRQMARATALPGGLEQFRAEALQMFDRNGNGRLDDEERTAAQKFAALRRDGAGEREELEKRFDKNADGKLDADERARVESFLSALRALGTVQMRFELMRQFDVNADGKFDEQEFIEVEKFLRPRIEASPEQLRRHDTNQDGKLDDAEWVKARAMIAEWLNGPGAPTETFASLTANMTPAQIEQFRLDAVAKEVARRRALRDAAMKAEASPK